MSIAMSLLPEFDHEMTGTRATLERIPDDRLDYRPHEKSMTLGRLAGHIAEMPTWIQMTFEVDDLDLAPGGQPAFEAFTAPVINVIPPQKASAIADRAGVSDATG